MEWEEVGFNVTPMSVPSVVLRSGKKEPVDWGN